jgi:hypothetical protein
MFPIKNGDVPQLYFKLSEGTTIYPSGTQGMKAEHLDPILTHRGALSFKNQ